MSKAKEILSRFPHHRQQMLNILHEIQDANEYHYLSDKDMEAVAEHFNTTKASIYGVVTYYSMLSTRPRGRHIIRICKSPVCHVSGAFSIADALKKQLGVKNIGETSADGQFTLEYTECLGQCAHSPGIQIDKDFYGNLDSGKLHDILNHYK
ncbi:MAG: NAD(P)H-dependent oxidoreductase subunit E [Bacteroidales bacterium]